MSETIHIEIDAGKVFSELDGLSKSAMQNAWRRTLRKTSVWIKSQVAKAVSKESRIPQKLLRARLHFFLRSYDTGKIWLGLNPIEADRLGTPRQTRSGVTVGRRSFSGAWVNRSPTKSLAGKVYQRVGRERRPYRRVKMDWEKQGEAAFHAAAEKVEERLLEILRQEINYEIQKAIGRA
ncbi:MAG: phage tail protein [Betaproteobacteria bacterium]|nr:phage tail protein [Betaproteobacteria bacterium]